MREMMMLQEFLKVMDSGEPITPGSQAAEMLEELTENACWMTNYMNCVAHTPEIVRKILSEIMGAPVDDSVIVRPPFFCGCGKNLHLGKGILIGQSCHLQDDGGLTIGDDCVIDQDVVITTMGRGAHLADRDVLYPKPVTLEPKVWIGAHCVILPGVTVQEGAVVTPGSVVFEDVPRETVVGGSPAHYMRDI